MKRQILLLSIVLLAAACTRHDCVRRFFQITVLVQNKVGERTLSFCKGGRRPGIEEVTVTHDAIGFTTVYTNDRQSRYDGSCSDYYAERDFSEKIPAALTSKNFAEVKLCYTSADKTAIILLPKNESCPAESQEQLAPVDDCSRI